MGWDAKLSVEYIHKFAVTLCVCVDLGLRGVRDRSR